MTSAKRNVAVLISGRGSNLAALMAACEDETYPARICLVVSNRIDAPGLRLAAEKRVPVSVVDDRAFTGKPAFEEKLNAALESSGAELICLAGFMRLLSADFVNTWRDRLINIHPSLLPLFPGLHTHERALAAGVKLHGATVHYVRHEMDTGPIIAQGAIRVRDGDTSDTLAARVLAMEHRLYPAALKLVAGDMAKVVGDRVAIDEASGAADQLLLSIAG